MFLGFAKFYRRFIQNFSRTIAPLISILRTTDDEALSTQATENKKDLNTPASGGGDTSGSGVGRSFENLLIIAKLGKSKKSKLTKSKKSDLPKANFAKVNSGIDFLTSEAKKAFIHLQKAFTKALILKHFDPECHIQIETDALGYAIGGIFSQMTLDHYFSGHVIYKDPNFSKSKIG